MDTARKRRDARRKAFLDVQSSLPGWFYHPPVINFGRASNARLSGPDADITMDESGGFAYCRHGDTVAGLTASQVIELASNSETRRAILTATPAMVHRYHALQLAGRFGRVGSLPIGI